MTRAALAQAGAVVVDDMTQLVDAAQALRLVRLPANAAPGVGVVTGQAGPGLLLADELGVQGVRMPELPQVSIDRLGELLPPITFQRNPVDTGPPRRDASVPCSRPSAARTGSICSPSICSRSPTPSTRSSCSAPRGRLPCSR